MKHLAEVPVHADMGLDEYVDFVRTNVDLLDMQSLEASVPLLARLARRDGLLEARLNDLLEAVADDVQADTHSPFSFELHRDTHFCVRANLWAPIARAAASRDAALNSYHLAHDHNFHFVTVGYAGAGYRTELFEYDEASIVGRVGERVELQERGQAYLRRGDAMVYEASRDVHVQFPPDDFSVSLNLVVHHPVLLARPQRFFDMRTRTIAPVLDDLVGLRYALIGMCRYLHDDATLDALTAVATRHGSPQARAAAFATLLEIEPQERERVERLVAEDPAADMPSHIAIARGFMDLQEPS